MKKIIVSIIISISLIMFPISVFATGYMSTSPSSLTIEVGSSKSITITAYNSIGDVTVSSSNNGIATVSPKEWGTGMVDEGQTKSGSISITGVSPGTATIFLDISAATFDPEDISGVKTVTVNVVPKTTQSTTSNINNSNNKSNNNSNNSNTDSKTDKSSNNNLKDLSIDDYKLTKIDNNNYSAVVRFNTETINVKTSSEDNKATITGTGEHKISIGENLVEIIITAENGSQNKILLHVTRKDAFYIDDLEYAINDTKYTNVDIKIKSDSKIASKEIELLKKSKKTVSFNYYNQDNNLQYSWIINGASINKITEFDTKVDSKSSKDKDIKKLSNYADGITAHFNNLGSYYKDTKIKLYVGDKYSNGDSVNIYYYDEKDNKLKYVKKDYKVNKGYVEFNVVGDNYFISMSKISGLEDAPKNSSSITIPILFFVFSFIVFVLSITIFYVRKRHNNKELSDESNNEEDNQNDDEKI